MTHSSTYTVKDQLKMVGAKNYFAWQAKLAARELGQRVVEAGCGIGNFTQMLLDREAVFCVDSEEECVDVLKERYRDRKNLHPFRCDISSTEFRDLCRFQPDSCVCLNVLEHIENDREALSAISSILVPGGVIVLIIPAFQALYGPIDRNLEHRRRYRRKHILNLARTLGLRVKKLHYLNLVGFFGWWVNARILKLEEQSELQIAVFDKYFVPLISACESFAKPPFGQSLFAVLEKS